MSTSTQSILSIFGCQCPSQVESSELWQRECLNSSRRPILLMCDKVYGCFPFWFLNLHRRWCISISCDALAGGQSGEFRLLPPCRTAFPAPTWRWGGGGVDPQVHPGQIRHELGPGSRVLGSLSWIASTDSSEGEGWPAAVLNPLQMSRIPSNRLRDFCIS